MSRALFDQTLAPKHANQKRRGTVMVSVALHALGLAVLLVLGVRAETPIVSSRLVLEIAPTPKMPEAPKPLPPRSTPNATPNAPAAPTEAPERTAPEDPRPASDGPPPMQVGDRSGGVPGGIDTRSVGLTAPPVPAPPRPPAVVTPRRVGGDIQAPQRISAVAPDYPQVARVAKIEGVVTLEATIDAQGNVRDVKVIGSIPLLDKAAVDAVSKWKYTPTRLNGEVIPVILTVRVVFSLR